MLSSTQTHTHTHISTHTHRAQLPAFGERILDFNIWNACSSLHNTVQCAVNNEHFSTWSWFAVASTFGNIFGWVRRMHTVPLCGVPPKKTYPAAATALFHRKWPWEGGYACSERRPRRQARTHRQLHRPARGVHQHAFINLCHHYRSISCAALRLCADQGDWHKKPPWYRRCSEARHQYTCYSWHHPQSRHKNGRDQTTSWPQLSREIEESK